MENNMAEEKVSLCLKKPVIAASVLGFVLLCSCGYLFQCASMGAEGDVEPELFYKIATGLKKAKSHVRVDAARKLAQCPNADPWIVLMLLSTQSPPPSGNSEEKERYVGMKSIRVGLATVLINALPKDCSSSILYALTYLLNDKTRGVWSDREGNIIFYRQGSYGGEPLRKEARDCLIKCLDVDHKWDASAWQKEIAERSAVGAGGKPRK
jgi:hypothetical protein